MIEVESQITATLLELSSYASNGDMGLPSDDNYPEKDILVNQSNCQAPHIEDFIVAHYLTEQREVCFWYFSKSGIHGKPIRRPNQLLKIPHNHPTIAPTLRSYPWSKFIFRIFINWRHWKQNTKLSLGMKFVLILKFCLSTSEKIE